MGFKTTKVVIIMAPYTRGGGPWHFSSRCYRAEGFERAVILNSNFPYECDTSRSYLSCRKYRAREIIVLAVNSCYIFLTFVFCIVSLFDYTQ